MKFRTFLKHHGPVFSNGVRPGVSLNLTQSATKPEVAFFKRRKASWTKYTLKSTPAYG